jgi:hypothetical protein
MDFATRAYWTEGPFIAVPSLHPWQKKQKKKEASPSRLRLNSNPFFKYFGKKKQKRRLNSGEECNEDLT